MYGILPCPFVRQQDAIGENRGQNPKFCLWFVLHPCRIMGEMADCDAMPFEHREVTVEYLAFFRGNPSPAAEAGSNTFTGKAVGDECFQNAVYLPWRRGTAAAHAARAARPRGRAGRP